MRQEGSGWLLFTLGFGLHFNTRSQLKKNCLQVEHQPNSGYEANNHFKEGKISTKVVS